MHAQFGCKLHLKLILNLYIQFYECWNFRHFRLLVSQDFLSAGRLKILNAIPQIVRPAVAGVLLCAATSNAYAAGHGELTVADLLTRCQKLQDSNRKGDGNTRTKPEADPDGAYCVGRIDGFRETLRLSVRLYRNAGFKQDWKPVVRICIPARQVSSQALAEIFTHWAKANSARAGEPATIGVYEAFRQAYPCVDTYR